jgi:hypothetical protein
MAQSYGPASSTSKSCKIRGDDEGEDVLSVFVKPMLFAAGLSTANRSKRKRLVRVSAGKAEKRLNCSGGSSLRRPSVICSELIA